MIVKIVAGVSVLRCPNCKSKNIGRIGNQHYYCWECFIELKLEENIFHMDQVEEDGSLSSLNDLFTEEDRSLQR
ncbi:hypothetical protein [Paraliobacillus sp. JSM ZJ581]|uniref:hypothetical protein n=1 Tax=Paraliobacillus sp. JSM ZJ581 TaxID=3342118 RepID=UPI0035A91371